MLSFSSGPTPADLYSTILSHPVLSIVAIFLVHQIGRVIYRLYFHPLAKFPGPRLTAVTRWYEIYYEMVLGGQFTEQIKRMHQQYGPIVRINPFEISIDDPDFYDSLYNFNPHLEKRKIGLDNLQHTASHEIHKIRRRAFDSFFSRQSVQKMEWLIQGSVKTLCDRLEEAKQSNQPVPLGKLLYPCFTADVASEYAFSQSHKFLANPAENESFFNAFYATFPLVFPLREIPGVSWALQAMVRLPKWMMPGDEGMAAITKWQSDLREKLRTTMSGDYKQTTDIEHRTVFAEFLNNNLPPEEKTEDRIMDNATLLVGSGFETTSYTLSTAHYHLLANPDICQRLKQELKTIWPEDEDAIPPWTTLEKLPYFKGVLQESLRLSMGAMTRLSRVNHHESIRYGEWVTPKDTPVGMSQFLIHYNEKIFPDPWKFDPERWLQGEKSKQLEKYVIAFSKGSRGCIGQHLARAELHLTLATVFHRFDMELYETTRKDVDPKHDYFVATPEMGSKGVRVIVK